MKLVEYTQPTSAPVPKVAAAGIAGVVVTAVVTVLALSGVVVPDNVSSSAEAAISGVVIVVTALQTVITFVAAYLKKDTAPVEVAKKLEETK